MKSDTKSMKANFAQAVPSEDLPPARPTGHTPGPWTLTHLGGSNFAVQTFEIRGMFGDAANVSPIFNKDVSAIDGTVIHCSPQDARLIAAAPELLAAAKCAQSVLFLLQDEVKALGCNAKNVPDMLRAAIAKTAGSAA